MHTATDIEQIALYEDPDHAVHLDVRVEGGTVWLTQQQMATLFGRDVTTIRRHLKSASKEELSGVPTSALYALVQNEVTRTAKRQGEIEEIERDKVYRIRHHLGKGPVMGRYIRSPKKTVCGTKSGAPRVIDGSRITVMARKVPQ